MLQIYQLVGIQRVLPQEYWSIFSGLRITTLTSALKTDQHTEERGDANFSLGMHFFYYIITSFLGNFGGLYSI